MLTGDAGPEGTRLMMRKLILLIFLAPLFISCSSTLEIEAEIAGPDFVYEHMYGVYSVSIENPDDYSYEWRTIPGYVRVFSDYLSVNEKLFFPWGVDSDTEITVAVIISDERGIATSRIKKVTIGDVPETFGFSPSATTNYFRTDSVQIEIDSDGNIYAAGTTFGSPTIQPMDTPIGIEPIGTTDAYLGKFSPDGDIIWFKNWGSPAPDFIDAMTLDSDGNICITGRFFDTVDFDPGPGVNSLESTSRFSQYITEFSPDGEHLLVRAIEISGQTRTTGLCSDSTGNLLVLGEIEQGSIAFDTPEGNEELRADELTVYYLAKMNNEGDCIWVKSWEKPEDGYLLIHEAIAMPDDEFLLLGFESGSWPVTGLDGPLGINTTMDLPPWEGGPTLTLFNPDGDTIWTRTWGDAYTYPETVTLDDSGNILVAGRFDVPADFDPGPGESILQLTPGNRIGHEGFLMKLSPAGDFIWALNTSSEPSQIVNHGGRTIFLGSHNSEMALAGQDWHSNPSLLRSGSYEDRSMGLFMTANNVAMDLPDFAVWDRPWADWVFSAATSSDGYIHYFGKFRGSMSFGQSKGEGQIQSNSFDGYSFLAKYDLDGNLQWVLNWGGEMPGLIQGIISCSG